MKARGSTGLLAMCFSIALQQESPYREPINAALLKLYETGQYDDIYQEWFG
jgi:polar amino acid transport system substrate-binding protein